jgi:adenylate cyclase
MGQPEQASRTAKQLLERAQEWSHRYTCALGMQLTAFVSILRDEPHLARELSAAIMTLGEESGFNELIETAHVPHGWARFRIGGEREGITEMESALADVARYETVNGSTSTLATIADARLHAGEARTALDLIERGLRTALETGERFYEAELLRLKGESILALGGDPVEAEACLRSAIDIARAQSAKWWELRAARSLARLLAGHAHREEARAILSGIYNWFTEGFDTADLKDAKALLEELSH